MIVNSGSKLKALKGVNNMYSPTFIHDPPASLSLFQLTCNTPPHEMYFDRTTVEEGINEDSSKLAKKDQNQKIKNNQLHSSQIDYLESNNSTKTLKISSSSYLVHDPISISSNDQFASQGFPGLGTFADPYVIEGFSITASSGDLINIRDTTFYFRIANCFLDGLTTNDWGINFENVINANIEKNLIRNTGVDGIGIYHSEYNSIINNTISNTDKGIRLESQSNYNILESNAISESSSGIAIINSSNNNTVTINTLFNNDDGIWLGTDGSPPPTGSKNNTISGNLIYNNYGAGMTLSAESNHNIITNNTIYNNPSFGVNLNEGSRNNLITDNAVFSNNLDGIYLDSSNNNLISNNLVHNNGWTGIKLGHSSDKNIISRNNVYNNTEFGLWLGEGGSSDENIISNNSFHNNNWGEIKLESSFNNTLTSNMISNNAVYGIEIDSGSNDNIVQWNNFIDNNLGGSSQAIDDGLSNIFVNNYWNEFTSPDTNSDRIVDNPYTVDGAANSQDLNPLVSMHLLTQFSIIYPNSGETLNDTVTIRWTIPGDSHYHPMTYSVYYSKDAESIWTLLVSGLTTPSYDWDTTTNINSVNYRILVVTTCSEGASTVDISDGKFTIKNKNPNEFIHVIAKIDGTDWFEMQGNKWRWQHKYDVVPETHLNNESDSEFPTNVNGQSFLSNWPEGDDYLDYSDWNIVTGLEPLEQKYGPDVEISLEIIQARDTLILEQLPDSENNYTFRVFLSDNEAGSALYEFKIWNGTKPLTAHSLTTPTILSPSGGETFENGIVSIQWLPSTDYFGHTVTYSVYYTDMTLLSSTAPDSTPPTTSTPTSLFFLYYCATSYFDATSIFFTSTADNEIKWNPIATGLTTTTYDWNINTVAGGTSYKIKVVASCTGGGTSESILDETFTIREAYEPYNPSPDFLSSLLPLLFLLIQYGFPLAIVGLFIWISQQKKKPVPVRYSQVSPFTPGGQTIGKSSVDSPMSDSFHCPLCEEPQDINFTFCSECGETLQAHREKIVSTPTSQATPFDIKEQSIQKEIRNEVPNIPSEILYSEQLTPEEAPVTFLASTSSDKQALFSSIQYRVKEVIYEEGETGPIVHLFPYFGSMKEITVKFYQNQIMMSGCLERSDNLIVNFELKIDELPESFSYDDPWQDIKLIGDENIILGIKQQSEIANRLTSIGTALVKVESSTKGEIWIELTFDESKEAVNHAYSLIKNLQTLIDNL
jgi:parallel beta-helix repeat protein